MTILSSRDFAIVTVSFLSSSTSAQQNVACPVAFETPLELTGTSFFIPKSSINTLCTLSQVSSDRTKVVPVGRSYDGNAFERVAGKFADQVSISCDINACLIDVPALPGDGSIYQLTSFESPTYYSNDDVIARFLEQTTFGPKRSEIDSISSPSPVTNLDFANWIKTQESLPYMSHREIFRVRSNTRYEVPTPAGRVTQPCEGGTRYRRWAFSTQDAEKSLEFSSLGGNKRLLTVDGYFRTVVDAPTYIFNNNMVTPQNFPNNLIYPIFGVYESMELGQSILVVFHPNLGQYVVLVFIEGGANYFSNPPVQFDGGVPPSNSFVLTLDTGDAQAIDEEYFQGFNLALPEIITTQDIDDTVCTTGGGIPKNNTEPVFATWNNELFIHDPRFRTLDNTVESPLTDGGGQVYQDYDNFIDPRVGTMCSNVPRSFVNEGSCFLSTSGSACSYRSELNGGASTFQMTGDLITAIYTATGAGLPGTTYLYAVEGLDTRAAEDTEVDPPCQPGVTSRWVSGPCSGEPFDTLDFTRLLMKNMIAYYETNGDPNPYMVDVYFPTENFQYSCPAADNTKKGFEVPDSSDSTICWRNVHPDHLNVYDFTIWTEDPPVGHPGNTPGGRNPIKEFAEADSSVLVFPSWHELDRWQGNKGKFGQPVRLGDEITLDDLPLDVRTDVDVLIEIGLGAYVPTSDPNQGIGSGPGTLVCGSPHEIANDPDLGGSFGKGAFDIDTLLYQFDDNSALERQRGEAWTIATLTDEAQLRQRIAWALSQILVVSPDSITEGETITEAYLVYYDIFVRNAFGNYRDVLKEVSYSVMMADMLTYYQGRSTEYVREQEGNAEFADENYAREIMQLFTTGLLKLNEDGTVMLDIGGDSELVYTNDDIEEYARAWTGFDGQERRGNMEILIVNRIDPMKINPLWRDQLPKMGLDGTYIGDGYPQCSDLPEKHFLTKGATYNLLGNTPLPELQSDPGEWQKGGVTMALDSSSSLYEKLCVTDGANCLFPTKVVLDETITTCNGAECSVDTVRTVEVSDGIYYEYVRPPCVHETFYNNAKTIVPRNDDGNTMCGNPLIETASVACCQGTDSGAWIWDEVYFGERNLFSTASDRCNSNLCNSNNRPVCDPESDSRCLSNNYFWTVEDCQVKVKVRADGKVAVVHSPQNEANEDVASKVQEDTSTFFRVDWDGDFGNLLLNCASTAGCDLSNDGNYCICEVSVSEEQVFTQISSADAATMLASLPIGAFETEIESRNVVPLPGGGFVYIDPNEGVGPGTIVQVTDSNGVQHLRKNKRSKVSITGSLSFRNPPHLINLGDPEARDAHYETDATLDHYFYNPNTPPFLAIRFAQRFGISNPSPRYVEAVSLAFRTGSFIYSDGSTSVEFGSGEYGDLAATFACILLDREARSVVLDADSSHGAFKEPLIKVLGTMRSLEFELREDVPWAAFGDLNGAIGQMAHQIPSVFSFFLPEYQPSGPISDASLVAPESQVLTGPMIIGSMNGILALIKYGLNPCLGGFGSAIARYDGELNCNSISIFDTDKSLGSLKFSPSDSSNAVSVVEELATLLTAGRLSPESRQIIESTYDPSDPSALVKAQMLISTTPEFHSTNIVRQNGGQRESEPLPPPSTLPYKAVVYVQLEGGYDSYNMLVPRTCSVTNGNGDTLLDQYISERTTIALTAEERSQSISATGQPCSEFAVHPNLPIVQQLYNNGDLSFFANTGVLDAPVTKLNYNQETKTQLFAHNTMQQEAQRIDPWDTTPGTGILGRMCDVLQEKGFAPQPITIDDATIATVGVPGEAIAPLIVSSRESTTFAPRPNNENFDVTEFVGALNSETDLHTSLYGETWSQKLIQAIADADRIADALDNANLSQDYSNKGRYAEQVKVLSSLIITQADRGTDRDVFFFKLRGWDHHADMKANLASNFDDLNSALDLFQSEMKVQGYWDQVTMVITSDFGRTLTANSQDGSDHAWGGNYFALGGDVAGGKIHGSYPPDITESGPLNIGRGRLIPTMSWESIWNSVAEWMGLAGDELEYCMPNRLNTGADLLLTEQDVFQQQSAPTRVPTTSPTTSPTRNPTTSPTRNPTTSPTSPPTQSPTRNPTTSPTSPPTQSPTRSPTTSPTPPQADTTPPPTRSPTRSPTTSPTAPPTPSPTRSPTTSPTAPPTPSPTRSPTTSPTVPPPSCCRCWWGGCLRWCC